MPYVSPHPSRNPNPCGPKSVSTPRVTFNSWISPFYSSTTSLLRDARQNVPLDRGEDNNSALNNPIVVGGRIYPFVLSFMNPMHDPTQIRLNDLRSHPPTTTIAVPTDESCTTPQSEKRRPPFAITLPTFTFSVVAFAKAWEYDEDNMVGDKCASWVDGRRYTSTLSRTAPGRGGNTGGKGTQKRVGTS